VFAAFFIAPMMEAASTFETSANFYQTTRLNNPEDSLFISFVFCAVSGIGFWLLVQHVKIKDYYYYYFVLNFSACL
jgi:hypothetical protein